MSIDRGLIRAAARRVAIGAGVLAFGVWLLVLRPQVLGGPAAYITVAGVSMEPALHAGDLVVVTRSDFYEPGDVVAYRVPDGDPAAGRQVIHRVIGGGPQAGYVLQGDNTPAPDRWRPRNGDIVGKQFIVVPAFGSVLMFVKQPAAIAGLAAAILVFIVPDWSATGGGAAPIRRGRPSAFRGRVASRAPTATVVTSNQAILHDTQSSTGECRAQVLVEYRNVGANWAELSAAMSTYTISAQGGATTAKGSFTSVSPRRLAPGETGYMLVDISHWRLRADQLVALSTVIACRDARPWLPGATQPPAWSFIPG